MAIYHFCAKIIGRSAGQSAVAAAAYRSGQRLTDSNGEVKRYSARAARVVFCGLFAPKGAPDWAQNREGLWNEVERVETRRHSTFCREYEIALPFELNHAQKIWLMQDFVREAFVRGAALSRRSSMKTMTRMLRRLLASPPEQLGPRC